MKKVIGCVLFGAVGCLAAVAGDTNEVVNVYDLTINTKAPVLEKGIRNYKSQKYVGQLYVSYVDGDVKSVLAETKCRSSGVLHVTEFSADSFYRLIGKTTETSLRSVPTVFLDGSDVCISGGNELFKSISLAGNGSVKTVKSVKTGCAVCGETYSTTEYCTVLWSAGGNVVGVMDCQCPDEETGWWHTVKACLCGVWTDDDGKIERSHDASFWGTWSIKFNKKLSDTKIN